MSAPPPCPITGAPGSVLVEELSPKFLTDLWRRGLGVDPAPLAATSPRIRLWRAASGLYFFHPAEAGSAAFYRSFYAGQGGYGLLSDHAAERTDFLAGAAVIRPGDHVLDIGCGQGAFAGLVPLADYTGLDLHAEALPGGPRVLRDCLADHADRHPGAYDVVCGFQVIEHVADPLVLAAAMVRCLRPGGLLVLAMPLQGGLLEQMPNCLLNLPPHHLSRWTPEAAAALAAALGLQPERIGPVAASRAHARFGWTVRLLPAAVRTGPALRTGWGVLLRLMLAWRLARPLAELLGLPSGTPPADIVLVARKPGGG
jgi:SAM-dependent methyltransferase